VNRRPSRPVLLLGALALSLLGSALPADGAPRAIRSYAKAIETMSPYQGQSMCSPAAKPGVVAFRDLLLRSYPGTRSLGISRACTVGGRSEHKEGRAFDWGVNVSRPAEKAAADDMIRWLHATDRYGNRFANARRLGVQYVIWNKRIWSAYAPTWRAYGGPSPHTDHVHVSFNWPGANKQTSFWTGRVVNATGATVPSAPPASPPPPAPPKVAPVVAAPPPARHDQTWKVSSAQAKGVSSPGSVVAGTQYLLTVSGTWVPGPMLKADAKCWLAARSTTWTRKGPSGGIGDLLVNGREIDLRPVTPSKNARGCDTTGHAYVGVVRPRRTGVVNLRVVDTSYPDNKGVLTARLTRWTPPARKDAPRPPEAEIVPDEAPRGPENVTVSATSGAGGSTKRSYAAGTKVVLRASGSYVYGPGVMVADAECSRWPSDRQWRPVSEWDPEGAGHLDLTVNGKVLPWTSFNSPKKDCDGKHEYFLRATLSTSGPIRFAVRDDVWGDNRGGLKVTVEVVR
jgi:hypothetical protein